MFYKASFNIGPSMYHSRSSAFPSSLISVLPFIKDFSGEEQLDESVE